MLAVDTTRPPPCTHPAPPWVELVLGNFQPHMHSLREMLAFGLLYCTPIPHGTNAARAHELMLAHLRSSVDGFQHLQLVATHAHPTPCDWDLTFPAHVDVTTGEEKPVRVRYLAGAYQVLLPGCSELVARSFTARDEFPSVTLERFLASLKDVSTHLEDQDEVALWAEFLRIGQGLSLIHI